MILKEDVHKIKLKTMNPIIAHLIKFNYKLFLKNKTLYLQIKIKSRKDWLTKENSISIKRINWLNKMKKKKKKV